MKQIFITILALLVIISLVTSCTTVPAGHVGVRVDYTEDDSTGIEVLSSPGYKRDIWGEEVFIFPVFERNYVWSKNANEGNPVDESVTIQTSEGLTANMDVGISINIDPTHVKQLYVRYRNGVDEIIDGPVRNLTRDALNKYASAIPAERLYSDGKVALMDSVRASLTRQLKPYGIIVNKVYLAGQIRLPESITQAINAKLAATQQAIQRENELREAEASSKIKIVQAEAEARVLALKSQALDERLIRYEAVKKWDGKLPQYMSGNAPVPFIDIN